MNEWQWNPGYMPVDPHDWVDVVFEGDTADDEPVQTQARFVVWDEDALPPVEKWRLAR